MAVFTIKALAGALAALGALTTGVVADDMPNPALTAQTTTFEPITQQHGIATADGNLVYSLSVCTIVQQTECSLLLSTGTEATFSIPTNELPTVSEGEPTTVHGMGETTPGGDYPEPSQTGPHASASTGSKPDYSPPEGSAPGVPVPVPVPSGGEQPVPSLPSGAPGEPIPLPSVISDTVESGIPTVLTTAPDGPSVTVAGSASGSGWDSDADYPTVTIPVESSDGPSATGEVGTDTPTGTPAVTASGAALMVHAGPAVVVGLAVMLVAVAF